jgi:DNA topoisomerase-1
VQKLRARGKLTATRGKKQTTDHPPIHPTGVGDPERLDGRQWRMYNLIARRFLATLSEAAVFEATKAEIDVAGETFVARGDVVVKPGFRGIYPYGMKKESQLPPLDEGDMVAFRGATLEEKETQPSSRYSQGKLIQEMEKRGLGTKATRHNIIQTLYDRKYVDKDPIEPTSRGVTVVGTLTKHAERITTPDMTAELEHDMDAIAESQKRRDGVVQHSRSLLEEVMRVLLEKVSGVRRGPPVEVLEEEQAVLRRVQRLPGVRGHLLAARREDRGHRRGVRGLRRAPDPLHQVPAEAARDVSRHRVLDQRRAGDRHRAVPER